MTDLKRLVVLSDPYSPASEAFRSLRMNLQFASLDAPIHSLLITSPDIDDNKETTLTNLAITLAQVDQQVILVDADLRRPSIHELLGLPNEKGLSNMVLEEETMEDPPLQWTAVDNLRVISAGQASTRPADILSSKRMEQVIKALTSQCDIVIFNAPPVLVATDASLLATRVDACLLVVTARKTKRDQVQHAADQLHKARANLLGAVVCNSETDMTISNY